MNYGKQPLSHQELLLHLRNRGLTVGDAAEAEKFLSRNGYYRLRAYLLPLRQKQLPGKPFKLGTTFEDAVRLHAFDEALRHLLSAALEKVEIACRASLVHEMCLRHGPHWHLQPGLFVPPKAPQGVKPKFTHPDFVQRIEKDLGVKPGGGLRRPHSEDFITHYFTKYTHPPLPPSWMVAETMTLGTLSLVLDHLSGRRERNAIAAPFGIQEDILRSWLQALTYLRNLCAHHTRVWNRRMVIKPVLSPKHLPFVTNNAHVFAMAAVLHLLLKHAGPDEGWSLRLSRLLAEHPSIDPAALGFPVDWRNEPFWNLPPDACTP